MRDVSQPLVSVIIPAYRQAHFLSQAIDSVLTQTYSNVAAIVVDDGSPDETPAVAARYGDQIRYIRQENAGVSAARNAGILASTGEFLVFLDADDYLQHDALEQLIRQARAHPEASVFHGSVQHVDVTGKPLEWREARPLGADVFHELLGGCPFPPCAVMIRRSAFATAGLFNGAMNGAEDWEMWHRLAVTGSMFIPTPGAVAMYRRHSTNGSKKSTSSWIAGCAVLEESMGYHRACRLCHQARRVGRRNLRNWCFYLLTEQMAAALESRNPRAGLTLAMRSPVVRTPILAPRLIKELNRYMRWSVVIAVRGAVLAKRPIH